MKLTSIIEIWGVLTVICIFSASSKDFPQPLENLPEKCRSVKWSSSDCILGPFDGRKLPNSTFELLCPKKEGRFLVSPYCGIYSICHRSGKLTVNRCQGNKKFNQSTQLCSLSENVCHDRIGVGIKDKSVLQNLTIVPVVLDGLNYEKDSIVGYGESYVRGKRETQDGPLHYTFPILNKRGSSSDKKKKVDPYPKAVCHLFGPGLYLHAKSKNLFISCGSGQAFVKACPYWTEFNPELSVCDWPKNRVKKNEQADDASSSTSSEIFVEDIGIENKLDGLYVKSFVAKSGLAGTWCTRNTAFEVRPDPVSCSRYLVCRRGQLFFGFCSDDKSFDPILQECISWEESQCKLKQTPTDSIELGCSPEKRYLMSVPNVCNKFIECSHGTLSIKMCPVGEHFHESSKKCKPADEVKCKMNRLFAPLSFTQASPITGENYDFVCDEDYRAPHPENCEKYVECEGGTSFVKSCGPGKVYNGLLGVCDWWYNTKRSLERDCSKFIKCEEGQEVVESCPDNTGFDHFKAKCVPDPKCFMDFIENSRPPFELNES